MNRIPNLVRLTTGAALCAALFVSGLSAPLATASAQTGTTTAAQRGGDLAQAVAALRGISTLQANFTQTTRSAQRMTGVLTLKAPGKIRFQYAKGIPQLIVSDGKALTFVDYEVRQVQRWPISNSPLGALLDPRRDVARFGTLVPTGDANVVAVEVRDRAHPEYGVITLIFKRKASAPGGLELQSWVALDSQNTRTTIILSNHRYGLPVADSTFRYNDPRQPARR